MRIFPVIVIYKIALKDAECYKSFLSKINVDRFMVYDNSPSDFKQIVEELPAAAVYVRDVSNGGVSVAYNAAARYATEHDYDRVLLLDQDTVFPLAMYDMMMQASNEICAPRIVLHDGTPFSPTVWKHGVLRGAALSPGEYSLKKYMLVNSGLCVSTRLFNLVGGYNEKVKLDFADFQFMARLQSVTDTFLLLDATAEQDFSNEKTSVDTLLFRYEKYVDGARHYQARSFKERIMISWLVLLHTIALTIRTKNMSFIKKMLGV